MIKKLAANPESLHWYGMFIILLIMSLAGSYIAMPPASDAAPRAEPILLQIAAEQPEETVGIIVQKQGKDTSPSTGSGRSVEELVAQLGGRVTKELHIINGFAAQLPAKAVLELARAHGVRWVSLDAPMLQAGEPIDISNPANAYVQAIGADR